MFHKSYSNFVRSTSPINLQNTNKCVLSGDEAKRLYLEEVSEHKEPYLPSSDNAFKLNRKARRTRNTERKKHSVSDIKIDKALFIAAQNNDVQIVKEMLDDCPDKISVIDDYGWSLLMIACQANSIDIVKELLKRGADSSIRDKAGNSARSLVIRNKNVMLADILLSHSKLEEKCTQRKKVKLKEKILCQICNKAFPDKEEHLSSTIHNINASKGRKVPTNYQIPECNKGYQLMLKVGWDKETGLGPDGTGNKYPIKAKQKKDRKGLGHEEKRIEDKSDTSKIVKLNQRREVANEYEKNRKMEINFRREFY